MRQMGYVACMVHIRNIYQVLAGKPEKKRYHFNDLSIFKRVILL
jgi:hypothetical protein